MGLSTNSPRTRLDLGANGVSHLRWGAWSELGEESSHNSLVLGNNVYVDGNNTKVRSTSNDGYRAIRMKYDEGITFHTTDASVNADDALDNERMRITTSGQMGLGTNNPVQQSGKGLHIHNSGGQTRIKLTNNVTGATANDGFDIIQEHNNDVHILNHENGILKLGTNDAERMRIDNAGRMALGTTSPVSIGSGYEGLTINASTAGTLYLQGGGTSGGRILATASDLYIGPVQSNGSTIIQRAHGSYETARFDSGGRFLIGTTVEGHTDADDFTVAGGASSHTGITIRSGTASKGAIYFSDGTSGNSEYRGYIEYNHQSDHLRFGTAAAEKVRIDSSGNMGVGNPSPAYKALSLNNRNN